MERPEFDFREAQCVFDLIRTLQTTEHARLSRLGGPELTKLVHESGCRFECPTQAACYEAVATRALDATEGAELAIAILLANDLQCGLWSDDVEEFAEAALPQIETAPNPLRSAILRALDTVADSTYPHLRRGPFLPHISRLTRPAEHILPRLCAMARAMDRFTRKSVSKADYGYLAKEHLEALNDVLASETCRFPKGEHWLPSEVVELVAYVRATPGFVPCTALLLANALPTSDALGWFDYRWSILAADYNTLPDSARAPILAGIRYLYEADSEGFQPCLETPCFDPHLTPERMIHLVDLPEDSA